MNFQNPFHSVQSMVCTGLELVAKINMPCHATGQEDTERAAQRGQPQGSTVGMPAQPPVPIGGGFVLAVHCGAASVLCPPTPLPSVTAAETDPDLTEPGSAHGTSRSKHSQGSPRVRAGHGGSWLSSQAVQAAPLSQLPLRRALRHCYAAPSSAP